MAVSGPHMFIQCPFLTQSYHSVLPFSFALLFLSRPPFLPLEFISYPMCTPTWHSLYWEPSSCPAPEAPGANKGNPIILCTMVIAKHLR